MRVRSPERSRAYPARRTHRSVSHAALMNSAEPTVVTLRAGGLELSLSNLGATWLSCRVPVGRQSQREVLLGRHTMTEPKARNAYIGATIGRYANRIGGARYVHERQVHVLVPNVGSPHQLHGGPEGFDLRRWDIRACSSQEVTFSLTSPAGDQGFPGEAKVAVVYRLVDESTIEMRAEAELSEESPVCLTNHAYFNLGGEPADVREHLLSVNAERYLPVDGDLIPLGDLASVAGTPFDFRRPKRLADDWLKDAQQQLAGGYDHAFLIDPTCSGMQRPVCALASPDGALGMEMYSTLPSLQLYAGQLLEGTPSRDGVPLPACAGVALEPQFLPDSPNHPEWPQPSCFFGPSRPYRHVIRWKFLR